MKPNRINNFSLFIFLSLAFIFAKPFSLKGERNTTPDLHPLMICDLQKAIDWCDNNTAFDTSSPIGIWDFPDDNISVLIVPQCRPQGNIQYPTYDIIIIDSPDVRLLPGVMAGTLESLPTSRDYKLTLFTRKRGLNLIAPKSCLATLAPDSKSIIVKKAKVSMSVSLNPSSLFGGFWKMLRINVKGDNPLYKSHGGMIRRYPNPDASPIHPAEQLLFF